MEGRCLDSSASDPFSLSVVIELCRALIHMPSRKGRWAFEVKRELDSGFAQRGVQAPRKSARVHIDAMVKFRRRGHHNFTVQAFDFSPEGCKLEFVEQPHMDEKVWIKFEGLELLEATVCWVENRQAGVEFVRPIHPAVFEMLVERVGAGPNH